jgi:hypothetical protein
MLLSFVAVKVYDIVGREVVTLLNEEKTMGSYEIKFDATDIPSGIYFFRTCVGDLVETKKMILLHQHYGG